MINLELNNDQIDIPEKDAEKSIRSTIYAASSSTSRRITKLLRAKNEKQAPSFSGIHQNVSLVNNSCINISGSASNSSSRGASSTKHMKKLDDSFTPGIYDVICARGAAAKKHTGNIDLKNKVIEVGDSYAKAPSRVFRSIIVSSIVSWVRSRSPNGGFVKKMSDGAWYEVGDEMAREKVGQALRDLNHAHYKSSMRAKRRRWKKEKQEQHSIDCQQEPQPQHGVVPTTIEFSAPNNTQYNNHYAEICFLRSHHDINRSRPQQLLPTALQSTAPPNRTQYNDLHAESCFLQSHHDTIQSSLRHVKQKWLECGGRSKDANEDQLLEIFTQHNIFLLKTLKQEATGSSPRQMQPEDVTMQLL